MKLKDFSDFAKKVDSSKFQECLNEANGDPNKLAVKTLELTVEILHQYHDWLSCNVSEK